jgi:hypothetical protein
MLITLSDDIFHLSRGFRMSGSGVYDDICGSDSVAVSEFGESVETLSEGGLFRSGWTLQCGLFTFSND